MLNNEWVVLSQGAAVIGYLGEDAVTLGEATLFGALLGHQSTIQPQVIAGNVIGVFAGEKGNR